jgi:RimJ/RimL family protein N-acetyltransferase
MKLVPLEICSERLRLIAIDLALSELQLADPGTFFDLLGVEPPAVWPPELMDREALEWAHKALESNPASKGWLFWVFILTGRDGGKDLACGAGGFKGPPDDAGTVEIGYSVLSEFRSRGLASEALEALIGWATASRKVQRVIGHTLPDLLASRRVMENAGLKEEARFFDQDEQLDVIRYGLDLSSSP